MESFDNEDALSVKRRSDDGDEKYRLDIQPVHKARRRSQRSNDDVIIDQGIQRLNIDTIMPTDDRKMWDEKGGARYAIVGSAGKGKTFIMRSIMFAKKHFIPVACVVSENEDVNNNFKKHIPNLFIYTENTSQIAEQVINRQRIACSQLPNANPLCLFIADDCMNDKRPFRDKSHIALFKLSRQLKLLYLLSCQYSLDLGPELRNNLTGVFLCRETRQESLEKLYKTYGGPIPDLDTFKQLMEQVTTDHCALYIDLSATTDDWLSNIYWFRAFETRPEVIGDWSAVCLDAQRFAAERYNPKYDPLDKIAGNMVH